MKMKIFFVFCFSMFIFFWSNLSQAFAQSDDLKDVETFIDKLMQEEMEKEHIPNATISIVLNGEVIIEKGYGLENIETKTPVDPKKSLFRIGSIAKLFTWTAVMQLVESGKLGLYTDVNEYIDFEIPAQLVTGKGNSNVQPITLHHLLTHTPGFEDYSETIYRLSESEVLPLNEYVSESLPKRVFPAGEVMAYSNYGTALAGYIVEQISGLPFETYIEQNIYQPLGMNHSTFNQPLEQELSVNMTQAYRYIDSEYVKGKFEFMPGPAGGMSSSASDMARFMIAYLEGGKLEGKQILQESTIKQMFTQQFTHDPRLDGMTLGFKERSKNGKRILFHGGGTMLFDSGLFLIPDEDVGIFLSYSGGNYQTHIKVFEAFMDRYFPEVEFTETVVSPKNNKSDDYRKFVGEYHQNRKSFTTSAKFVSLTSGLIQIDADEDGSLLVTREGETNRFVKEAPGVYYNTYDNKTIDPYGPFATIVFDTDPLGKTILTTDGPMTYSKAPWYSTSGFTFLSLIVAIAYIIGSLIYSGIRSGVRFVRRKTTEKGKLGTYARRVAIIYSIITIGFIAEVIVTGEFDPVYGLPKTYFSVETVWEKALGFLPTLMFGLGIILIFLTVIIWIKKYSSIGSRIHYTLFTMNTMILGWLFLYWNLL